MLNDDWKYGVFYGDEQKGKRLHCSWGNLIWFALALVAAVVVGAMPTVVLLGLWKFVPEPVGFWQRFVIFISSLTLIVSQLAWLEIYLDPVLRSLYQDFQDWRRGIFRFRSRG